MTEKRKRGRPAGSKTRPRNADIEIASAYEEVNHPSHYGGKDNPYEVIKVTDAWELTPALTSSVTYIARAGRKPGVSKLKDLRKAHWYIEHEIERLQRIALKISELDT